MSDKYPYDIGDKIIGEFYPVESNLGGIIDYVDIGELHSLLAKFYEALPIRTFTQEDLSKATTAIAKMPYSSFREGSKLKVAMLGEDMTPIAKAALEAVGGKIV